MEKSISNITKLYELYKKSPNTINKLEFYINTQLPNLLKKFNDQELTRLFLEKESKKYINDFLTNSEQQFFYIEATNIFIKYDGKNYNTIDEDNLWMMILSDITNKEVLVEWKQKIKDSIIKNIKEKKYLKIFLIHIQVQISM